MFGDLVLELDPAVGLEVDVRSSGGSIDTASDRINLRVTGAFSGVDAIAYEHDHIIRINRQFTTLFGYGDEEAVGKNIIRADDVGLPTINGYAYYYYRTSALWRVTARQV